MAIISTQYRIAVKARQKSMPAVVNGSIPSKGSDCHSNGTVSNGRSGVVPQKATTTRMLEQFITNFKEMEDYRSVRAVSLTNLQSCDEPSSGMANPL
jgi:hypothetical protein